MIEHDINRLAEQLGQHEDLQLAFLFGSGATQRETSASDVDVAVLAEYPLSAARRAELTREIGEATGRPVDLVDLRTAGVPAVRAALVYGRRLFVRDRRACENLHARMLRDAADFLPYHRRMLRQRRTQWIR